MATDAFPSDELLDVGPETADVTYDVAQVADAFLERIGDEVNLTPEAEERIRAAAGAALTPEDALAAAQRVSLESLEMTDGDDTLREQEAQAIDFAAEEMRSAWRRQGDAGEEG